MAANLFPAPTPSDLYALDTLILISFTVLVYEYCLTVTLEVERFWSAKQLTWSIFLFFFNRYFTLAGHVPIMVEYFWYSVEPSKLTIYRDLHAYTQYLAMAIQIVVSALLIVRTFALYEGNRRVLALLLGVVFVALAIAFWLVLSREKKGLEEHFSAVGCPLAMSQSNAIRYAEAWSGMLVFDTFVFGLTVRRSMELHKITGSSILTLILRDGSVYFGVMVATNLANILMLVYSGPYTRGIITTPMNVISSIMITRLMLNLRDPRLMAAPKFPTLTGITFHDLDAHVFSTLEVRTDDVELTEVGRTDW